MPRSASVTVLVTYRPRKGKDAQLLRLLRRHWSALRKEGLVTPRQPRLWRAQDKRTGQWHFVEMFAWRDAEASERAHASPGVLAVWGPMEPLLERMEIAVVEPVELRP